jgi:hypothetical protein
MVTKKFILHTKNSIIKKKINNIFYVIPKYLAIDLLNNICCPWIRKDGTKIDKHQLFFEIYWKNKLNEIKNEIKEIKWKDVNIFIINIVDNIYYSFTFDILLEEKIITDYGKLIYKEIKNNCPICLELLHYNCNCSKKKEKNKYSNVINQLKYLFKKKIIKTHCNHHFHKKCISQWNKNNCPLCRKLFKQYKIYKKIKKYSFNKNNTIIAYI